MYYVQELKDLSMVLAALQPHSHLYLSTFLFTEKKRKTTISPLLSLFLQYYEHSENRGDQYQWTDQKKRPTSSQVESQWLKNLVEQIPSFPIVSPNHVLPTNQRTSKNSLESKENTKYLYRYFNFDQYNNQYTYYCSYSQLNMFRQCPYSMYLNYVCHYG